MDSLWKELTEGAEKNQLSGEEDRLYKTLGKALKLFSANPFYPGLSSHEISTFTKEYGRKIYESYLENKTPGAALSQSQAS
jgi:hypothetical protein